MTVQLSTPGGQTFLIALDDQVPIDVTHPVLARSEIDAALSLACRIAPPDCLRLTLRRVLLDLIATKQALPYPAAFCAPGELRGRTVDVREAVTEPVEVAPEAQQLDLLDDATR